jgi:DNA-binding response OmpR family regulator
MGKRILVVDDENDILEVLDVLLSEEGYEVETSPTAEGILTKIEEFHPNLILLDVFIGYKDGRKVCKNLKSIERLKDIPIIMLSSYSSIGNSIQEVGAEDFIPKPFSLYTLIDHIEKQLHA